jgi:hypothetical protein
VLQPHHLHSPSVPCRPGRRPRPRPADSPSGPHLLTKLPPTRRPLSFPRAPARRTRSCPRCAALAFGFFTAPSRAPLPAFAPSPSGTNPTQRSRLTSSLPFLFLCPPIDIPPHLRTRCFVHRTSPPSPPTSPLTFSKTIRLHPTPHLPTSSIDRFGSGRSSEEGPRGRGGAQIRGYR